YLLDATEPLLPIGMLPVRALNGEGYLVREENHGWVPLQPTVSSKYINTEVTLKEDGELAGKTMESAGGQYAFAMRKSLKDSGEEKFAENLASEAGNFTLGKPTFENKDDIGSPFNVTYSIKANGNGQASLIY